VTQEDLILDLPDMCGISIENARKLAPEVEKAYLEDTKLLNPNLVQGNDMEQKLIPPVSNQGNIPNVSEPPIQNDVLVIKYDKYAVTLPKDKSEKERVGKFLKAMINLELGLKSDAN